MNTAIRFDNVVKRYGRQSVLKGVSLDVQEGEFLGLVGVNGAGKTTLIKCLLDLCETDAGAIGIFGVPHTQTAARANLAFLPERFLPPHYATGWEFLRFIADLHAVSVPRAALTKVLAALDFDLTALVKPVRNLSKGMAQKLGLAATLLSDRRLLILDEPMSGLDPKARALFKRHLLELKRGGNRTVFFSTHMLSDVEALCDRIAVLHEGVICHVGTPAECCARFGTGDLEQAYLNCVAS